MAVCDPTSPSLRKPMADPAERRSSDAATDRSIDLDLVEYLVVVSDLGSLRTVTSVLADLVASEAIRILDLVCVSRSAEGGELTVVEFGEVEGMALLEHVEGEIGGLLSARDIDTAARPLTWGSSAMVLLMEDRWARGLSTAARQAGGRVVGGGRVARPLVEAALKGTHRPEAADEKPGDGE
jgi:hypothetical protein